MNKFSFSKSLFQLSKRGFSTKKPFSQRRILVAGCKGQIGLPLVKQLCQEVGVQNVIAADINDKNTDLPCKVEHICVSDFKEYEKLVKEYKIDYIVHLAAILSALGEKQPDRALEVNVDGALNALKLARQYNCQIFIPSSIAVFGGEIFPKQNTPVDTILQPETVYGVTKAFNEQIGTYFHKKFGVDFRSIRYPGVISSAKYDFNGTTDYSTEIFFAALEKGYYECWLGPNTELPMIYIDDCVRATIQFLKADDSRFQRRVYNMAGISFTPEQLAHSIQKMMPDFKIDYVPDFRQKIADAWPKTIDDHFSKVEWDWSYDINVDELAKKIMEGIDESYKKGKKIFL